MVLNVIRTAISAYLLNVQILPVISPVLKEGVTVFDEYRILMNAFMGGELTIVMWVLALMGLADLLIRVFFGDYPEITGICAPAFQGSSGCAAKSRICSPPS